MCFTNSFIRHFFAPARIATSFFSLDPIISWLSYHGHYTTQFANILCIYVGRNTNVMKKSLLFDGGLILSPTGLNTFLRPQKMGEEKKMANGFWEFEKAFSAFVL